LAAQYQDPLQCNAKFRTKWQGNQGERNKFTFLFLQVFFVVIIFVVIYLGLFLFLALLFLRWGSVISGKGRIANWRASRLGWDESGTSWYQIDVRHSVFTPS
jgi:hypothetical protein